MSKENYEDDYDIVLTKQKPNGKGKNVEKRKKGGNKKDKPIYNSKYVRTKENNLTKTEK
tara:strand:- start:3076 stop:3252 length:177 start_codon:yes stop_codon:yes gene_type:complete